MTLHFEVFETVVFFLSVLVVTYVIQDGKSNYLEGAMVSFFPATKERLLRPWMRGEEGRKGMKDGS